MKEVILKKDEHVTYPENASISKFYAVHPVGNPKEKRFLFRDDENNYLLIYPRDMVSKYISYHGSVQYGETINDNIEWLLNHSYQVFEFNSWKDMFMWICE